VNKTIPFKYLLLYILLVVFISLLFGLSMISITRGHLVAPLDDSYIHFQYARRLAQGHFFEYTEGSGFSTGGTSILYPILLAPFILLGFHGVKILLVSYALGSLCLCFSAILIHLIGRQISEERVGILAALLFLVNGNLAWNYLSGMETGLFATLILASVYFLMRWWMEKRDWLLAALCFCLTLTSLTRPEGIAILILCLVVIVRRAYSIHGASSLACFLSLVPFSLYMFYVKLETGSFETAGLISKSATAAPYYSLWEKIAKVGDNLSLIFGGYYHNLSSNYFHVLPMFPLAPLGALYPFLLFPPAAFLLALLGTILAGARERRNVPILVVALVLFIGLLSVTNSEVVAVHYFRYLSPFQPLFFLLVALGVNELSKLFETSHTRIFNLSGIILLLLMIPSPFYWAYIYGENGNDIFEQHRRTSWWIKDATPQDAVIGITDAGIIGYFGERRIYDLVGLTTPDQGIHWRQGLGSCFERLENLPPEDLPDYIVSFPFLWGEINFLGKPLHNAPLLKNLTTMSNDFVVYEQDWSLLHSGDLPKEMPPDFQLADSLDVADLRDEAAHRYQWREAAERPVGWSYPNPRNFFHKAPGTGKIIADGGRNLTDCETFVVRLKPGKPVLVIARTESQNTAVAQVSVNGTRIGRLMVSGTPGRFWQEPSLLIPGEHITETKNQIQVTFDRDVSKSGSFHSYHYWFFQ